MNTVEAAYKRGYEDKLAGAGQHIKAMYDRLLEGHDEANVTGQSVAGGAVGAGLGGLATLTGQAIPKALAKAKPGMPGGVDAMYKLLQDAAAGGKGLGSGMNAMSPAWTRGLAGVARLGKAPLLTTAIPAGVLALLAGIRAYKSNNRS